MRKFLAILLALVFVFGLFACGNNNNNNNNNNDPCASGHSWGEWVEVKAATCLEAGSKQRTCKNDASHVERETIAALGHNFVEGVCSRCGAKDPNYNPGGQGGEGDKCKDGHTFGEWVVVKAASCTEAGSRQRTCSVCNKADVETIPALGHAFVMGVCIRCGAIDPNFNPGGQGDDERCKDGHTYGEWITVTEASCLLPGAKYRVCSVCGNTEAGVIPALGHDFVDGVCSRCGAEQSIDPIIIPDLPDLEPIEGGLAIHYQLGEEDFDGKLWINEGVLYFAVDTFDGAGVPTTRVFELPLSDLYGVGVDFVKELINQMGIEQLDGMVDQLPEELPVDLDLDALIEIYNLAKDVDFSQYISVNNGVYEISLGFIGDLDLSSLLPEELQGDEMKPMVDAMVAQLASFSAKLDTTIPNGLSFVVSGKSALGLTVRPVDIYLELDEEGFVKLQANINIDLAELLPILPINASLVANVDYDIRGGRMVHDIDIEFMDYAISSDLDFHFVEGQVPSLAYNFVVKSGESAFDEHTFLSMVANFSEEEGLGFDFVLDIPGEEGSLLGDIYGELVAELIPIADQEGVFDFAIKSIDKAGEEDVVFSGKLTSRNGLFELVFAPEDDVECVVRATNLRSRYTLEYFYYDIEDGQKDLVGKLVGRYNSETQEGSLIIATADGENEEEAIDDKDLIMLDGSFTADSLHLVVYSDYSDEEPMELFFVNFEDNELELRTHEIHRERKQIEGEAEPTVEITDAVMHVHAKLDLSDPVLLAEQLVNGDVAMVFVDLGVDEETGAINLLVPMLGLQASLTKADDHQNLVASFMGYDVVANIYENSFDALVSYEEENIFYINLGLGFDENEEGEQELTTVALEMSIAIGREGYQVEEPKEPQPIGEPKGMAKAGDAPALQIINIMLVAQKGEGLHLYVDGPEFVMDLAVDLAEKEAVLTVVSDPMHILFEVDLENISLHLEQKMDMQGQEEPALLCEYTISLNGIDYHAYNPSSGLETARVILNEEDGFAFILYSGSDDNEIAYQVVASKNEEGNYVIDLDTPQRDLPNEGILPAIKGQVVITPNDVSADLVLNGNGVEVPVKFEGSFVDGLLSIDLDASEIQVQDLVDPLPGLKASLRLSEEGLFVEGEKEKNAFELTITPLDLAHVKDLEGQDSNINVINTFVRPMVPSLVEVLLSYVENLFGGENGGEVKPQPQYEAPFVQNVEILINGEFDSYLMPDSKNEGVFKGYIYLEEGQVVALNACTLYPAEDYRMDKIPMGPYSIDETGYYQLYLVANYNYEEYKLELGGGCGYYGPEAPLLDGAYLTVFGYDPEGQETLICNKVYLDGPFAIQVEEGMYYRAMVMEVEGDGQSYYDFSFELDPKQPGYNWNYEYIMLGFGPGVYEFSVGYFEDGSLIIDEDSFVFVSE